MSNELTRLHQFIVRHYSGKELRTLCFVLGVNYDDLGGEGLTAQARELILHLGRRRQLDRLLDQLQKERTKPFADARISAATTTVDTLYDELDSFTVSVGEPGTGTVDPGRPSILFDQSHGQDRWWTAPPVISRGYRALSTSLKQTYEVKSLRTGQPLTYDTLQGYTALVLAIGPQGLCYLSQAEIEAIEYFVDDGGGLLVLGTYTGDWHHEANLNQLIENYGITFEKNIVVPSNIERPLPGDLKIDSRDVVNAAPVSENGGKAAGSLTAGVGQVAILSACSLYVDPGAAITLIHAPKEASTLEPIPIGVTTSISGWRRVSLEALPLVAACHSVKVVVSGSWKMFLDDFVSADAYDNLTLVRNILHWFAAT